MTSTPKKIYSQIDQHCKFLEKKNKASNKKNRGRKGNRIDEVKGETVCLKVTG